MPFAFRRSVSRPHPRRLAALAACVLIGVGGCQPNEGITTAVEKRLDYGAPKPKAPDGKQEKVPTRILGGIADAGGGQAWFFKMMGPAEEVSKQQAAFDKFLDSLEFADGKDKPVTWTLPEGWRRTADRPGRFATLATGPIPGGGVELSVILLGGGLLENVNRWRGQVGLEPVNDIAAGTTEVTTKQGKKVIRVDASGMADKNPVMPPFMKGHP